MEYAESQVVSCSYKSLRPSPIVVVMYILATEISIHVSGLDLWVHIVLHEGLVYLLI